MKKIVSLLMLFLVCSFFIILTTYATDAPVYDEAYNNNSGAFYANGTEITIDENASGETVISWNGGSQVVPKTVSVFGGGSNGTNYDSSNITMNGGTVTYLSGGGISLDEEKISSVTNAKITVNNGNVLVGVIGGGFVYSKVENIEIVINGGNIAAVGGGGIASIAIDGVSYSAGTEDDAQNSKNRTDTINITINGGTINSSSLNYGLLYGGGQGYSYTGTTNVIINDGDLTKAYVTVGGSNGYTNSGNVIVNGGKIGIIQSVNRGTIESATLTINNGTIKNLYVAGETGDTSVTGTINGVRVNLLGGSIETLEPGKSNSQEIEIDNIKYYVIKTNNANIINDNISSGEVIVDYSLKLKESDIDLMLGESKDLEVIIETNPTGYEYLFNDKITWESSNNNIATVSKNGAITGVNEGNAVITATLFNYEQSVNVSVWSNYIYAIIILTIIIIIISIVMIIVFIIYRRRTCCICICHKR